MYAASLANEGRKVQDKWQNGAWSLLIVRENLYLIYRGVFHGPKHDVTKSKMRARTTLGRGQIYGRII